MEDAYAMSRNLSTGKATRRVIFLRRVGRGLRRPFDGKRFTDPQPSFKVGLGHGLNQKKGTLKRARIPQGGRWEK